ncbi:MAG: hypothetical protein Q4C65_14315 [Eubacteriales bacterium]|nr:hypothetical protein [Eubacteriales bacterium]
MDDKKKDLIPVAAIALFLVIIIILCVVRLQEKKGSRESTAGATQMVQTAESGTQTEETAGGEEMQIRTGELSQKETQARTGAAETETAQDNQAQAAEHPDSQLPDGKTKEQQETGKKKTPSVRTISGNDPLAGAESGNKTNEEMLLEMSGYWDQDNMEAVEDLAMLPWYMKMSASIVDEDTFYYYGERNDQGQPQGMGVACYADNAYYYGQWANGKREGQGKWVHYYVYYDDDTTSDRAYRQHMYAGEWANDMPNGDGQEHYDLDMDQAAVRDRYIQNVIGTFRDGLYSGEMYLTTLSWDGNQEEWNGLADEGVWSPYGAGTNRKEVPVCQDVDDSSNYLWLSVKDNRDRGINELMP